jgi:hypothetical protein
MNWLLYGKRCSVVEPAKVGEMIVYCTFSGMRRAVEVTAVHEVIKNGRPGFDGVDSGGKTYWGYDDQIVLRMWPTRGMSDGNNNNTDIL